MSTSPLNWPTALHHTRITSAGRKTRSAAMSTSHGIASWQHLDSLRGLPEQYQGLLLDQFGVLHDGKVPYPGAVEAVEKLAASGRQLLVLSNSSNRATQTLGKLEGMGFNPAWFVGAVTSGETTHNCLLGRPTLFWQRLGNRCVHITWGERASISLEGLSLQVVSNPCDAQFVLVHGTECIGQEDGSVKDASLDELMALLKECANVGGLPMICANPDVVTVSGNELVIMPGTLSIAYQKMGGTVHHMGKPDPIIYQAAAEIMALPPAQLLGVGDSLDNDIAGAVGAGISSIFITSGIHADELKSHAQQATGRHYDDLKLQALLQKLGLTTTFVMESLVW